MVRGDGGSSSYGRKGHHHHSLVGGGSSIGRVEGPIDTAACDDGERMQGCEDDRV